MDTTMVTILPTNKDELDRYKADPRLWIEARLETLRPHSPLIQAVFESTIKNGLSDRFFYLLLSYYAMDRVIRLEQQLNKDQRKRPRIPAKTLSASPSLERIKL